MVQNDRCITHYLVGGLFEFGLDIVDDLGRASILLGGGGIDIRLL